MFDWAWTHDTLAIPLHTFKPDKVSCKISKGNNDTSPCVSPLTIRLAINTAVSHLYMAGNYIIQVSRGLSQCLSIKTPEGEACYWLIHLQWNDISTVSHGRKWCSYDVPDHVGRNIHGVTVETSSANECPSFFSFQNVITSLKWALVQACTDGWWSES